jgi:flagellar hook protein FlgE
MTGAMYAAIGGLKSHMTKLNVIGNNVANVNTHGYKAQRMTFQESIYTTSRSGSNGGVTMGGNNPSQIGYGCSVGSIDLNMAPSTYAPTGVALDCMLTGEGFFMVGDKIDYDIEETGTPGEDDYNRTVTGSGIRNAEGLNEPLLTRVGDFWVDADGYICNRDNKVLYGFARVQNPNYKPGATKAEIAEQKAKGIDIESATIISTELVPLRVPLSAAAPTEKNGGLVEVTEDGETTTKALWKEGDPVYPYLSATGENRYASYKEVPSPVDPDKTTGDGSQAVAGKSQIAVAQNTNEKRVSDELITQLKGMSIGPDGSITGTCEGKTVVIGYVAIASADSPDGVTHMDGRYYKAMGGAGSLRVAALVDLPTKYLGNQVVTGEGDDMVAPPAADAILNDSGNSVKNGGLEASSTDVANEFAEMITTQRGYQANTRIVTVTDQMLEELVNMKR